MTRSRAAAPSPTGDDWMAVAERTRAAIEAAPTGHKIPAVAALAAEFGISRDHLRRAVAAARLLEKMRARGVVVPEELRRVPVGVVDIVSRWAGYDQQAAFAAAKAYATGDLQFRDLMRAEQAARPKGRTRRGPRRLDVLRAWKETSLAKARPALREAGLDLIDENLEELPVDAWARGGDGTHMTAILIVGPHTELARYDQEREAVLLRGCGIAFLGHRVWIVVPGTALALRYQEWLERRRIPPSALRIIGLPPATAPR